MYAYAKAPPPGSLGVPPGRLIAYGQSLGSAVATHLASSRPVAALIFVSTLASCLRVALRGGGGL